MTAGLLARGSRWLAALLAGLLLAIGLTVTAPPVVDLDVGGDDAGALTGVYDRETHHGRRIRWTDGDARLAWPGVVGVVPSGVEVELAPFFGRAGDQVVVSAGSTRVRHALGEGFVVMWLPTSAPPSGLLVEIRSDHHLAPPDTRRLGVRLDRISIHNGPVSSRLRDVGGFAWLVLVSTGALAWAAASWVVGTPTPYKFHRPLAGGLAVLAVGVALSVERIRLLSDVGLRALACALVVGVVMVLLLRRGRSYGRGQALTVAVGTGVVWLMLVASVTPYFVDVPRWDIWETVELIDQALTGQFALSSLWSAHNEHRPLTGRVVVLASALWTHWNHWWELAALLTVPLLQVLLVATFAGGATYGRRRIHPLALVGAAIFVCTLTQWENWLRGYHVHILMGALAPMAGLLVLSCAKPTWWYTVLAAGLMVLGQLSFGTGLVAWPIGALAIAIRGGDGWRARLGAWLVAGGLATALYFPGLPPRPGRDASMLGHVLTVRGAIRLAAGTMVPIAMPVLYVPDAFAGPLSSVQVTVVTFAVASVVLALALIARAIWRDGRADPGWLFPATLVVFGLAACLLAALGRVSMGLYAMTASRYLVFSAAFWVGLMCLLGREISAPRQWSSVGALLLVIGASVASLATWPRAVPYMEHDAWTGRTARAQLQRGEVGVAAATLYPDPHKLARMRGILVRHQLSVFRPNAR